jgi:hypothetical protein
MIDVLVIRKNRTMRSKRISEKKDEFNFEKGRYYIQPDKVIFKKVLFWAKPFLLYFEGVPIPIGIENIHPIKIDFEELQDDEILTMTETDKEIYHMSYMLYMEHRKTEIMINSQSIHDLVSTDVLSVLTKKTMSPFELVLLALVILTLLMSIAGVNV